MLSSWSTTPPSTVSVRVGSSSSHWGRSGPRTRALLGAGGRGSRVLVKDAGSSLDSSQRVDDPAAVVVDEIRGVGGEAVANREDVSSCAGAERLVRSCLEAFGRLDALDCSAGNLADAPLTEMSADAWGSVVATHLTGQAGLLRFAAKHWRDQVEQTGLPSTGRVVLTSSAAGLWGDVGRLNYSSAKAGAAMLGVTAARELASYGIAVNACIKVSVVASDIFGVSGRAMMAALVAGERDPRVLVRPRHRLPRARTRPLRPQRQHQRQETQPHPSARSPRLQVTLEPAA